MSNTLSRRLWAASLLACGMVAWGQQSASPAPMSAPGTTRTLKLEPGAHPEAPSGFQVLRSEMTGSTALEDESTRLLNVDFAAWCCVQVGFAAVGHGTNDLWNGYAAPWALLGELTHTVWSDGSPSPVSLRVDNAPGMWGSFVKDPMYRTYIYPHDGGAITVTVSNLPPALYDLYLYGHGGPNEEQAQTQSPCNQQNSLFSVSTPANGAYYGQAATTSTAAWCDPAWKEGSQYVVFRKIAVTDGLIEIVVQPGASSYAILSGLQLVEVGNLSGLREDYSAVVSIGKPKKNRPAASPSVPPQTRRLSARPVADELGAGLLEEEGNLAFERAIRAYKQAIAQFDRQRPSAANAIFRLGECYRKLGRFEEAKVQYARILREFPDQTRLVEFSRGFLAAPVSAEAPPGPPSEE